MNSKPEISLELHDTEWEFTYTDHERKIVRAIVVDDEENYYFVKVQRNDDFGRLTLIETASGGVENGENPDEAIKRELKEELGADVDIICKIGTVKDFYNLIHRRNINNYYLCRIKSLGEKNMTKEEIEEFHLATLKLSYDEAAAEYNRCSKTKLGKLIAERELPILKRARELMSMQSKCIEKNAL